MCTRKDCIPEQTTTGYPSENDGNITAAPVYGESYADDKRTIHGQVDEIFLRIIKNRIRKTIFTTKNADT